MKINLKKIEGLKRNARALAKIPWFLGTHAFSILILLMLLNIVVGLFVFYSYIVVAQKKNPVPLEYIKFNSTAYERILQQQTARQNAIEQILSQGYTNPF